MNHFSIFWKYLGNKGLERKQHFVHISEIFLILFLISDFKVIIHFQVSQKILEPAWSSNLNFQIEEFQAFWPYRAWYVRNCQTSVKMKPESEKMQKLNLIDQN